MKGNELYGQIQSTLTEATRFVHLVGVGKHPACLARQLKPGDQLVFDRGVKGILKDKQETTPAFLTLIVQVGKSTEQIKVRKDKLVGVVRQKKRQRPAGPAPLPAPPPAAPALPPL